MSNYTEKLERYLQKADSQHSASSSIISSVNQSLNDSSNSKMSHSNQGPQSLNTKTTAKKSQLLPSTTQSHSDSFSQHNSNVCSPTVLHDITNSKRNNQHLQLKNSYLVNLLPSESVSFTNDCKSEPSSLLATRKGSEFDNNFPLRQDSLASNTKNPSEHYYSKETLSNTGKKFDQKENQFLKKSSPAINFSQNNTYNIEDFLPEPTFLRLNNYHSGFGISAGINAVPQMAGQQNVNFNSNNSNFGDMNLQVGSPIVNEFGAISYGNTAMFGGLGSNVQKKADLRPSSNDSSQIDSSISDGQFSSFSNAGQGQLDHTIASETEGRIDERSREEIKRFVKTNLLDGEKSSNLPSNEYADFLSRILIKLIENIPHLQNLGTKDGNLFPAHNLPDTKKKEGKLVGKAHRLRIQNLEPINYVPEKKYRNEGIQVVDSEFGTSAYNVRYLPEVSEPASSKGFQNDTYPSEKPPIFHNAATKSSQPLSFKKQSVSSQKTFTMTTDLASLDELSDSSMDHSNQGSETYFRSRLNNIQNRKARSSWESSKNTTQLSDTLDSELEFDIPRGRGSVTQAIPAYQRSEEQPRFSFKRPPIDQSPFTQDMRKIVSASLSLPRSSSVKRPEYVAEDSNKAGVLNTTARFNSHSTAFNEKSNVTSEYERCFSSGRFSEKSPQPRNSFASGKKTTPFIERSSRGLDKLGSERKLGSDIKKREVMINENNEVVFVDGQNSQESSMRSQETSSRGFKEAKLLSGSTSMNASGHRSPSPHFNQSKNSSLSKSSNEDWSPSRVQLEYSVSNSHVSRMNSLAIDSISRHDSRTGRTGCEKSATKGVLENKKKGDSGTYDQNDALFKSSLLATGDFGINNSDTKVVGWRPVRFGSREKIDEFFKSY